MNSVLTKKKQTQKMFIAAKFVGSHGCTRVSIQTVDVDAAILAFKWTLDQKKWKDPKSYRGNFREKFFESSTCLHAFSGCDSMSAFHGIGKRKGLNIVKSDEEDCKALGLLGESLQVEDALFDMIESAVCQLMDF